MVFWECAANGCCEGRGPWSYGGTLGFFPQAGLQIPGSLAALRLLSLWLLVTLGLPSALRSWTPVVPASSGRQAPVCSP